MKKPFVIIYVIIVILFLCTWFFSEHQGKDSFDVMTLFVATSGVFATGFGAYIGAKIAGDNANKLMKEQLVMSELSDKSKFDSEFLYDFNKIYSEKGIINSLTRQNFHFQMFNYMEANNEFNNLNINEISQFLKYQFNDFFLYFNRFVIDLEFLNMNLDRSIEEYIEKVLNVEQKSYEEIIIDFKFKNLVDKLYSSDTSDEIKYSIVEIFDYRDSVLKTEYYVEIDFGNLYNFVLNENEKDIENLVSSVKSLNDKYDKLRFKEPGNLYKYFYDFYIK